MTSTAVKLQTGRELRQLLAKLAQAMSETIGSLIARELSVQLGELEPVDAGQLLTSISGPHATVRGGLDKDYAGRKLLVLFDVRDAIAMAGMLMMTPDHVIEERRNAGKLEGEDLEAFGELGNVLCSGLGNVLREAMANIDLRLQDTGILAPGRDETHLLPEGDLVVQLLRLRVGTLPETTARLVLDRATADGWNKGPLLPPPTAVDEAPTVEPKADPGDRSEDALDDIPAAPIRGRMHAFVQGRDALRVLRRCCRRIGLALQRHGVAEVPNPAAHKGEFVLIDIPSHEPRRFEWCRRIKEFDASTKVVMLLHHPSRDRVKRAFLAGADLIVGLPVDEPELSRRISALFPS